MMQKNIIHFSQGENESYSDKALYNIIYWGVDYSFGEFINKYKENEIIKPELQRKYVWTPKEASRFIDSVLLGLPTPGIFLAKREDERLLIVDGYQRIMTVHDFLEGKFSDTGKDFELSNTKSIHTKWRGKNFSELEYEEQRKIKNALIHTVVFMQKHPKDDTGMYQIFERINTTGKTLKPQEIRNCVYYGVFNKLLIEMNEYIVWRHLLGPIVPDSRMNDVELILRFFTLLDLYDKGFEKNKLFLLKN